MEGQFSEMWPHWCGRTDEDSSESDSNLLSLVMLASEHSSFGGGLLPLLGDSPPSSCTGELRSCFGQSGLSLLEPSGNKFTSLSITISSLVEPFLLRSMVIIQR